MDHTLFVYGILRSRDTVSGIIGHHYSGTMTDAILPRSIVVRNMGPAYLFADESAFVEGVLIDGLSDEDLEQIDHVEGTDHDHYVRKPVIALTDAGEVEAEAYYAGERVIANRAKRSEYETFTKHIEAEWREVQERVEVEGNDETFECNRPAGEGDDETNPSLEGWLAMQESGAMRAEWEDEEREASGLLPNDLTQTLPVEREHFQPRYPDTEAHLPDRRGFGLPNSKRTTDAPSDAIHSIFVYDKLRSLDCLEMTLDREWFGTREPFSVSGYTRTNSFPPFAVPTQDADAEILGHLLTGITAEDLVALDKYMNVASGFYRRKVVRFGKSKRVIMWVAGPKAETILAVAKRHSSLAKRARRDADARRDRQRAERIARKLNRKSSAQTSTTATTTPASTAVAVRRMTPEDHAMWGQPRNGAAKVSWKPTPFNAG